MRQPGVGDPRQAEVEALQRCKPLSCTSPPSPRRVPVRFSSRSRGPLERDQPLAGDVGEADVEPAQLFKGFQVAEAEAGDGRDARAPAQEQLVGGGAAADGQLLQGGSGRGKLLRAWSPSACA